MSETLFENILESMEEKTNKEMAEIISDDRVLEEMFFDFIMAEQKKLYSDKANPIFHQNQLNGIPNLIVELFQPENYLVFLLDLSSEKRKEWVELVANHFYDKEINDLGERNDEYNDMCFDR